MKYLGSKRRIAKYILPIILANRKPEQVFVDIMCGGCNLIDKVTGNRLANDANFYLIEMLKGLQNNLDYPTEIPKELYTQYRNAYNAKDSSMSDFLIGWIGWMASFNGRFFDGGYSGKTATRDYVDENIRNTLTQLPNLLGIDFHSGCYREVTIPLSSIIYCDIPYKDTKQYATSKNFDYERFYDWCVEKHLQGHKVFISEYAMPENFVCVWEM